MSRRAPLSTLPNAINSPYHGAGKGKRQRPQREVTYGQPPPIKKQIVEVTVKTPVRHSHPESRVPPARKQVLRARGGAGGSPQAFNNAVADPRQHHHHHLNQHQQAQRKVANRHGDAQSNLDNVRAWQRHYKKAFPAYVFYFESIPDDVAAKCQKQIAALGARLERFFSSAVTHVVTTRTIPPEAATTSQLDPKTQIATINPSLLDREGAPKAEFTFKAPSRKYSTNRISQDEIREGGSRAAARGPGGTLLKAREYGMKIWALEKFQRMMNVMFEVTPDQTTVPRNREAGHHAQPTPANVDLTHVLRNERLHGPTDRDPSAAPTDLVYFKGYFIYVHDMMGINRPIMVREFQKVSKREQGTWPQFRSVSGGKCPFIEEAVHQKRERERERQMERMERARDKELAEVAKSRGVRLYQQEEATRNKPRRPALSDVRNIERRLDQDRTAGVPSRHVGKDGLFQVPPVIPAKRASVNTTNDVAFTSANPTVTQGGEPAASGVQPSNITSAIRSQMVSSIADQPGRRAGTSKGIYELKRKVAGNVLLGNATTGKAIPHSQRMIDLAGAARTEGQQSLRASQERKRKLGLDERVEVRDEREDAEKRTKPKAKGSSRKERRPGYCENCREKFDDFDDHTHSRRHRKFAANDENWADLDILLAGLTRPLRRPQPQRPPKKSLA